MCTRAYWKCILKSIISAIYPNEHLCNVFRYINKCGEMQLFSVDFYCMNTLRVIFIQRCGVHAQGIFFSELPLLMWARKYSQACCYLMYLLYIIHLIKGSEKQTRFGIVDLVIDSLEHVVCSKSTFCFEDKWLQLIFTKREKAMRRYKKSVPAHSPSKWTQNGKSNDVCSVLRGNIDGSRMIILEGKIEFLCKYDASLKYTVAFHMSYFSKLSKPNSVHFSSKQTPTNLIFLMIFRWKYCIEATEGLRNMHYTHTQHHHDQIEQFKLLIACLMQYIKLSII